jgi:hypothetical protein
LIGKRADGRSQQEPTVDPNNEDSDGHAGDNMEDDLVESVKSMRIATKTASESWASPTQPGKERVSFGTDLSTEDDSMRSSADQDVVTQEKTAVDQFHDRKFGGNPTGKIDKRPNLKVQGPTRVTKKQRTPVKTALKGLVQDAEMEESSEAKMEEALASGAALTKSESKHLTGTLPEARQEERGYSAGTAEGWDSPGQFKSLAVLCAISVCLLFLFLKPNNRRIGYQI